MKKLIGLGLLMFMVSGICAQDYQTSVGVRAGFASGLNFKHFIEKEKAVEGIISVGSWGMTLTGLYEVHARAFDTEGWRWYYGGGAHIGNWNDDYPWLDGEGNAMIVGLDGILGLEYKIQEIPITVSVDYKPTLNFTGYPGFLGYGGALSIRYTF